MNMALSEALLSPIPGSNPCGRDLRYDAVYDKVKEARREDDEAPQGDWQRERKRADYTLVLKLCLDALSNQSKDLQLAAWAMEALLKRDSVAGLHDGIKLTRGLLEGFWDHLYPELEDGDAELRATPLNWIGTQMADRVRRIPLTRSGLNWLQYRESRSVPSEAECGDSESKQQMRAEAIAEGKMAPEEFDSAIAITPNAFYEELLREFDASISSLEALDKLCVARFTEEVRPNFTPLLETLKEVRATVNSIFSKRPQSVPTLAVESTSDAGTLLVNNTHEMGSAAAAAAPAMSVAKSPASEPNSVEEAVARVVGAARFLRSSDPSNPIPYLLLRALRWGELRASGSDVDLSQLEAPASELRKQIRQAVQNGEWDRVLELAEDAMSTPCGRGWLDLQRYAFRASLEQGNSQVASAIRSELRTLLSDYPRLAQATLNDETPVANPETQEWVQELVGSETTKQQQEVSGTAAAPERVEPTADSSTRDPYELAKEAARAGRPEDAIEILNHQAMQERSGRSRFQRKIQLAQICMAAGHESVAHPILEALAAEVDLRQLEQWESSEFVALPLGMLLRCLEKLKKNSAATERIYSRLCQLDPVQAVQFSR